MKYFFLIFFLFSLISCSKDAHDYTMGELYKDYYVQKQVEKELTNDEKNIIDEAEKQYISRGMEDELKAKTLGELIKEFSNQTSLLNINSVTKLKILNKIISSENNIQSLKWKIQIFNKSKKEIIHVQGWLVIHDKKTKEIMRHDTIDCQITIKSNSSVVFITNFQDFDSGNEGNRIINNLNIKELQNQYEWVPVTVMFGDSTELSKVNM